MYEQGVALLDPVDAAVGADLGLVMPPAGAWATAVAGAVLLDPSLVPAFDPTALLDQFGKPALRSAAGPPRPADPGAPASAPATPRPRPVPTRAGDPIKREDGIVAPYGPLTLGAVIAALPPGPELAAAIETACTGGQRLNPYEQIDVVAACERMTSWAAGCQQRVIAGLGRGFVRGLFDFTPEAVGAVLRLSPRTAQNRVGIAKVMCKSYPATLAALEAGRISYWQANVIIEGTVNLPGDVCRQIEERVLARAERWSISETRRAVERAAVAVDPARAEDRHTKTVADRNVSTAPCVDGMGWLTGFLPADDLAAVTHVLDALTDLAWRSRDPGDTRTKAQLRADTFTAVFAEHLAGDRLPASAGRKPVINVLVSAETLLGLDDRPATLSGHGAITAGQARRIAAESDARWRRLLTDPIDGRLLHFGRTVYEPPDDLQDFVAERAGTCLFMHCQRPARRSEFDHHKKWRHNGTTDPDNIGPLCRRHHIAKDHGPWRLIPVGSGSVQWIDPTGHTYRVDPPNLRDP